MLQLATIEEQVKENMNRHENDVIKSIKYSLKALMDQMKQVLSVLYEQ